MEAVLFGEEELKSNRQRLDMLEQAEQKALRLHLYLPNYSVDKLDEELRRIAEQRRQLEYEVSSLERQLAELRQAMVDEEGLRRFCKIASRNLDVLDDSQWRILLEIMRLRVFVDGGRITIKIAVPSVKEEQSVIVAGTNIKVTAG